MSGVVQQAALALGSGATVAIAGQGIVQIYRGSGVLNFAHGAIALGSAQVFVWLWTDHSWPLLPAIVAAVVVGALTGLLTHVLVMRPLRSASQLVRITATIGVMQVVQQGSQLLFGGTPRFVKSFLQDGAFRFAGISVQRSALTLIGVAVALTLVLWGTMTFSKFGLATRGVAENELIARSVGRSPDLVAALNWTLGGALAGLAGVLVVPIGGLAISSILLIMVPAFAAAVIGGFRSYLLTTAGAILIAMGQSIFTFQAVTSGWPASIAPALPFLVVVVVLALRSSSLPRRDQVAARLPKVSTARVRPVAVVGVGVALALTSLCSTGLSNAILTSVITAIVGLSLVVVTGLSGQISLGQFAVAGLGALAAGRVSDLAGWPFPVCVAVGMVAAAASGCIFALPALRTRGPALAVVTIGLGLAVQQGILADVRITGGFNGATPVERPRFFGIAVNATQHPNRYAAISILVFAVAAASIATLRRSPVGRRLLAVRNNERAAAAMGISVAWTKLYAFTIAGAIAGAGGALMAFRFDAVQYGQFNFFASLQLVSFVLIGGIGYVLGPLVGALGVPNGIIAWLAEGAGNLERWLVLAAGVLLIATLIGAPDGAMAAIAKTFRARARNVTSPAASDEAKRSESIGPKHSWRAAALKVEGLGVRFGNVVAVNGVSVHVNPGEVTGLIGANGAGKTTLIDAVSGFVSMAGGRLWLGAVGGRLARSAPPVHRRWDRRDKVVGRVHPEVPPQRRHVSRMVRR